ncbi:MAG: class I SAM-dependent methyltransferase [Acidimicrobiia bacterium]|nr:class I SAM-dependent methyltransferase [Acidimicrobiia bacterium]
MSDQRPHSTGEFESYYQGEAPPWDINRPQPALAAVADQWTGRFLDIGCGTGEHAMLAASRGLEAVGVDAAPTAIARAEHKARERGLTVRFFVADVLEPSSIGERFDTAVDCGVFHVFDDDGRARYVRTLSEVLSPGGRVYLLCFSDRQPGDWGPRRVREEELRASFADGWRVESIKPAQLSVTFMPEGGIESWLATFTRWPAS